MLKAYSLNSYSIQHFLINLEDTMSKISTKHTAIITGDMNKDLIKYSMEDNYQYISTLMAYGYLPYITLPTRITDFSASCIDHIFIRDTSRYSERHTEISAGILYCDITDHLPCFVTLTCSNSHADERPFVRLYGEKSTLKFKELTLNVNWDAIYTNGSDWYVSFINLVHTKF